MDHWGVKDFLRKLQHMILEAHTRHQRLLLIILFLRITILTVFQSNEVIAQITTEAITIPKS